MIMKKAVSGALALAIAAGTVLPSAVSESGLFADSTIAALAADNYDFTKAKAVTFGKKMTGNFSMSHKYDIYKLDVAAPGKLSIDFQGDMYDVKYNIVDAEFNTVLKDKFEYKDNNVKVKIDYDLYLSKGTYYLSVIRGSEYEGDKYDGAYDLTVSFKNAKETFAESYKGSNNTLSAASPLTLGKTVTSVLTATDGADTYGFKISKPGQVDVKVSSDLDGYIYIYDKDGKQLYKEYIFKDIKTGAASKDLVFYLNKGMYYLQVTSFTGGFNGNYYNNQYIGKTVLKTKFTATNESFAESTNGSNNTLDKAKSIKTDTVYTGFTGINDTVDYYKFTVPKKDDVTVSIKGKDNSRKLLVFDKNGKEKAFILSLKDSFTGEYYSERKLTGLPKGTYYLKVDSNISPYYGEYELSVSLASVKIPVKTANVSTSGKSYSYTGKKIKPKPVITLNGKLLTKGVDYKLSYKNNKKVGKATMTITGIGKYKGTKKVTFFITPKKAVLTKVTVQKGAVKATYKVNTTGSAAQIQVSKNKRFGKAAIAKTVTVKNGKTKNNKAKSKVIKGLKRNKTYYVRVRHTVKIGKKTKFGKWSTVKKIKTK